MRLMLFQEKGRGRDEVISSPHLILIQNPLLRNANKLLLLGREQEWNFLLCSIPCSVESGDYFYFMLSCSCKVSVYII
jgi:hypothetical protein